jgi:hypothetical protein
LERLGEEKLSVSVFHTFSFMVALMIRLLVPDSCRMIGRFIGKCLQQQQTPGLDLALPLWRLLLRQKLTPVV